MDGYQVFVGSLIATAVIGCGVCSGAYYWGSDETQTCTVEDKDRSTSDGTSVYRVYTEDCGVLEVGDAMLRGNFNAADDYAAIEVGETYEFHTIGWRIPFLSQFPTIIEYESL
jgi:hypothetical protein